MPSPWRVCKPRWKRRPRRERKQKRGKRAGIRVRLYLCPYRPALPSLFMANVRSLTNKLDEIHVRLANKSPLKTCSLMIFTETWLNDSILDSVVQLTDRSLFRSDRTMESGKTRGGGLCVYVNNNWCTDASLVATFCSVNVEYMVVKCRPFYLPREFSVALVMAVYIPPSAHVESALDILHAAIVKLETKYVEGVLLVAGDFNQARLKVVLPKFYQYVKVPTRGGNVLDHVYCNIKDAYATFRYPNIGHSDHMSLFLVPAYKTVVQRFRPTSTSITVWPEGAMQKLQDALEFTDWGLFIEESLGDDNNVNVDSLTSMVLGYVCCCIQSVTIKKCVRTYANDKPWINGTVRTLLSERDKAFRSGDQNVFRAARQKLKKGIIEAKRAFSVKLESKFKNDKDAKSLWKGIQDISDYKVNKNPSHKEADSSLGETLNIFYSRFDSMAVSPVDWDGNLENAEPLVLDELSVRRCFASSKSGAVRWVPSCILDQPERGSLPGTPALLYLPDLPDTEPSTRVELS
ncbi:uncharacterized protein LOC134969848 [Pseudophryne corroboree]|uniref:uncharacterized protein LOC134969848 n=1 Tax=Pseudophryne corroboree TaxID=495146 RepID=UPI0030816E6D